VPRLFYRREHRENARRVAQRKCKVYCGLEQWFNNEYVEAPRLCPEFFTAENAGGMLAELRRGNAKFIAAWSSSLMPSMWRLDDCAPTFLPQRTQRECSQSCAEEMQRNY